MLECCNSLTASYYVQERYIYDTVKKSLCTIISYRFSSCTCMYRRLRRAKRSRTLRGTQKKSKGGHLRIDTDYLFTPQSQQSHVVIVPDAHGHERSLNYINVLLETFGERFSWIALEYILQGFGDHLQRFLDRIQTPITEAVCNVFCNCFIYGERRDGVQPCSKLYAPHVEYARKLLGILKKFDKVICLEMGDRPPHVEQSWASYLPATGNGIVVVGAEHVLPLSREIHKQRNSISYTIFRHYLPPVYHFIKPTTYLLKNGESAPFSYTTASERAPSMRVSMRALPLMPMRAPLPMPMRAPPPMPMRAPPPNVRRSSSSSRANNTKRQLRISSLKHATRREDWSTRKTPLTPSFSSSSMQAKRANRVSRRGR